MATVAYHTLHGTQTVVLDEAVTTDSGEVFPAGEYEFDVDGRYWTDFDRSNPIEAAAREQAWTGTAHGLVAELGVGTVTHSTLQLGLALAGTVRRSRTRAHGHRRWPGVGQPGQGRSSPTRSRSRSSPIASTATPRSSQPDRTRRTIEDGPSL